MKQKTQNSAPLELTATCQIEAVASENQEGQAPALPRFRMLAYTGGAMRVGGWRYPVVVDLAGLAIPSQNRPIRFGHDAASGVGHTDSISVEAGQLVATGVVSRDTPAAREIVVSGKRGFPWQASIGANVEQFEFIREGQKALANGKEFEGPINIVRQSILGEISFVDLGADGNTSATVAAKATEEPNMHSNENTQKQDQAQQQPASADTPSVTATKEPAEPVQAAAVEAAVDPVAQRLCRCCAGASIEPARSFDQSAYPCIRHGFDPQ